ncbi:tyrosine-type recombinase/integrase [Streptomyces sp. NPDC006261]|uniref:tyrosine-type recombinase/integrase n=1 Tax=Streptomyces sp. NPDC006261 TaxID=3156739 RepID=UPI0033B1FFC0
MAHIRQVPRANGGVAHEVQWRDHGRKRQKTFKDDRKAERFANRIEDELAAGKNTALHVERRTVGEVFEACMVASEGRLKPRTLGGYRTNYDRHVSKVFGQRRITSIRPHDVEKWVGVLSKTLKPGTVRNIFNLLSKLCKYALRHEWIATNPCFGVELPTDTAGADGVVEPRVFLAPAQVELLAQELAKKTPHYGLIVRMAAYTGLRAGELAALRIRDVNVFRQTVEVRRAMHRRKGQGFVYTTPKSKKSARDVPLTPTLVGELSAWLAAHPDKANPDAPLWPGSRNTGKGGAVDWSRQFDIGTMCKNHFRPARKRTEGIPDKLRWHDLRHTYASIMAAARVDVRLVSQWMGHSSISVTEAVYTHLFVTDYTSVMAQVGAFVAGPGQALGQASAVSPIFGGAAVR